MIRGLVPAQSHARSGPPPRHPRLRHPRLRYDRHHYLPDHRRHHLLRLQLHPLHHHHCRCLQQQQRGRRKVKKEPLLKLSAR